MLQQATVDLIREEARALTPVRSLLTLIAAMLFGLGWCVAKAFGVVWLGIAWSLAAVKVGWKSAQGDG